MIFDYKQWLSDEIPLARQNIQTLEQHALSAYQDGNKSQVVKLIVRINNWRILLESFEDDYRKLHTQDKVYICQWCGNEAKTLIDVGKYQYCNDCEIEAME